MRSLVVLVAWLIMAAVLIAPLTYFIVAWMLS